jgi:hypothetical protein
MNSYAQNTPAGPAPTIIQSYFTKTPPSDLEVVPYYYIIIYKKKKTKNFHKKKGDTLPNLMIHI